MKFDDVGSNVQTNDSVQKDEGAARAISSFIDPSLSWKDLAFFKKITKMPIFLKGVQCWEVRRSIHAAIVMRLSDVDFSGNRMP